MQTISKYFVAFLLTLITSVFSDGNQETSQQEAAIHQSIQKSQPCAKALDQQQPSLKES